MAAAGHAEGPLFRRLSRRDALTLLQYQTVRSRDWSSIMRQQRAMTRRSSRGHSLRAGFFTKGGSQGATTFKFQEVSRHKSVQVLVD
jgi:hypothetical protein